MSARLAPLRMLAALLAALALLAPGMAAAQAEGCVASGSERGFGGTGLDAGDRGFGGTGLDAGDRGFGGTGLDAGTDRGFGGTGHGDGERGFGGTGLQAGVYGTVTGFGSVCVNGLRIGYDAETPVERAGRPVEPGELARGQSVVVDAAWRDGAWHADRISVEPSISGPVTAVEAANGRLEVMGERVTTAGAQGLGLDGLRPGDLVSIHGLRGVAGIAATRIEWAPAGERDSVVGRAASASDGGISIGATAIRGIEPAVGRAVRASGVWDADVGALVASAVRPALEFAPGTELVSVEARVGRRMGERLETPIVTIDATRVADVLDAVGPRDRVWAEGRLDASGVLEAEHITVDPHGGGLPEPDLQGDGGHGGLPRGFDGTLGRRGRAADGPAARGEPEPGGHDRGDARHDREREDHADREREDHADREREAPGDREGEHGERAHERGEDPRDIFSHSFYDPRDFLEGPRLHEPDPERGEHHEARRSDEEHRRGEEREAREHEADDPEHEAKAEEHEHEVEWDLETELEAQIEDHYEVGEHYDGGDHYEAEFEQEHESEHEQEHDD